MVEPNIIKTKYYTLVSADTGHGKTLWCKVFTKFGGLNKIT